MAENQASSPALPALSFYSYDSPGNPWLSGGGALRDFEVLKRQRSDWGKITVFAGFYPGFQAGIRDGIEYRSLGWGQKYLFTRLTFSLLANIKVLFDRSPIIGNAISIYAPILTGLLVPRKYFIVAHHFIGKQSLRKFGAMGILPLVCEWVLFRFSRTFIISNGNLAAQIRGMNPRADVLQTQNGFNNALLEQPSLQADPPFLLFLGRFDIYMKGLDLLIQAFSRLKPEVRGNVRLKISGRASEEAIVAVEKLLTPEAAGFVDLVPNISEARKNELLAACLFYCSPSRFEGWGIAALEANAAGKPVLVTETDGFRDSIKGDYSGLMVPVGDAEALINAMQRLIQDATLREELGRNAREWARQFSWEKIAGKERDWIRSRLNV